MDYRLLAEIQAATNNGAWLLALHGTLALPDIGAALEDPKGRTSGQKYRGWWDAQLGSVYPEINAEEIWQLRCSALHQSRTKTRTYSRVAFLAPSPSGFAHRSVVYDAMVLDLPTFVADVCRAFHGRCESLKGSEPFDKNAGSLLRWHPGGLPPYMVGLPVLS